MKEKIWSFGVPFLIVVAGCLVANVLYDSMKRKQAKTPGETETSGKAGK